MVRRMICWTICLGILSILLLVSCQQTPSPTPTPISDVRMQIAESPLLPLFSPLPITPFLSPLASPSLPPPIPPTSIPQPVDWWPRPLITLDLGVPAGNGYHPQGMTLHPDKKLMYVHCRLGGPGERGLLSIIGLTDGQVLAAVPLGHTDMVAPPPVLDLQRGRAYLINDGDGTATVIDLSDLMAVTALADVEVLAVDPGRGWLYLADSSAPASLRRLDAITYAEQARLTLPPAGETTALVALPSLDRICLVRLTTDHNALLSLHRADTLNTLVESTFAGRPLALAADGEAGRLYLVLQCDGQVELVILDAQSGEERARQPLSESYGPVALAVDQGADRLYVGGRLSPGRTTGGGPGVQVRDGVSGQLVAEYSLGNVTVGGLALTPEGDLYVSLVYEHTLLHLDPATGQEVVRIPTAIEVEELALDPESGRLYVTDSSGHLRVLDTQDYAEVARLPGRGAVALDPQRNRVYVGTAEGNATQVLDGATLERRGTIPQRGIPVHPATGQLYLLDRGVYVADPERGEIIGWLEGTSFTPSGLSPNPFAVGLAVDGLNDRLYVTMNNGVPGSNNGNYLCIHEGSSHTRVFTDTELSVWSVALDEKQDRAYVTRARFFNLSLALLEGGQKWAKRVEGLAGQAAFDPLRRRLYLSEDWGDFSRLLALEADTLNLRASVPLEAGYRLAAIDPQADLLYLKGPGGRVLVMQGSGRPPADPPQPAMLPQAPVEQMLPAPGGLLLALVDGRLYRSEDNGRSWALLRGGLPPNPPLADLALAPGGALLAGLGDMGRGGGIYRSTDGGATWQVSSDGLTDLLVQEVVWATDSTAFARTQKRGLFRSQDGGQSWEPLGAGYAVEGKAQAGALAVSPDFASDRTLFLARSGGISALLRSTDGGDTWPQLLPGYVEQIFLSPDFTQDRTIFALLSGAGLMRSTDGGEKWEAANAGLVPDPGLALHDLCFAPRGVLYALFTPRGLEGASALYSSTDGGDHWQRLAGGLEQESVLSTLALATEGTLLLGTRQGQVLTLNPDALSWQAAAAGIGEAQITALAFAPWPVDRQDQVLFATGPTAGVFRSDDGGQTWQDLGFPTRAGGGEKVSLVLSPHYPADNKHPVDGIIFVASPGGVYRSQDGGATWEVLTKGLGPLFPAAALAVSPNFGYDRTLFLGGDYRQPQVFVSHDGGQSWQQASQGLPPTSSGLVALVCSPHFVDDRTIYAWVQYEGLYRSPDGGLSWMQVFAAPDWFLQLLAVAPDGTLFAGTLYGGLYRSADQGLNWQSLAEGLPSEARGATWVKAIAPSPQFPSDGTLFVGLDQGLYRSTDGGASWQPAWEGIPADADGTPPSILALALSPNLERDRILIAATVEHGLYKSSDGGAYWVAIGAATK